MLAANAPAQMSLPFGSEAAFINTIPIASQIGITPGAASFTDGFPPLCFAAPDSGGVAPRGSDFNGLLNMFSNAITWAQAGSNYIYNAAFQTAIGGYPKGALLVRSDYTGFWLAQTDNNTANPETFGTGWVPFLSAAVVDLTLSNANVSLTALQAANDVIVLSGTLTANVTITLGNWIGKKWTVINNTTGVFTVTLTVGSGSTPTVAQGQNEQVVCTSSGLTVINSFSAWIAGLPTTLPGTAGLPWNNGGSLDIS